MREGEQEREKEREKESGCNVFYDLILDVTQCHFCLLLSVTQTNLGTVWEGMNARRCGSLGPPWRWATTQNYILRLLQPQPLAFGIGLAGAPFGVELPDLAN